MNYRPRANYGYIWYTHETSPLLCFWLTVEVAKFSECQNQSARYAFLFMYVSCPPLPSGGFQHDYDVTKLGKIIQTAKFFFGKVLEGVQNYLRVLLSPPHIKLLKVSGFKDESVKIILLSRCAKFFLSLIPQHFDLTLFISSWATKSCSGFCHVRGFT